jgi:hypothetical protein
MTGMMRQCVNLSAGWYEMIAGRRLRNDPAHVSAVAMMIRPIVGR